MVDSGHGVLPNQVFGGHFWAQIVDLGAHVAVGQLEPSAGVGVGKFLGVVEEVARDFLVVGIHAQRQVGGGHVGRMLLVGVESVHNHVLGLAVLGCPLDGACRALDLFPLVLEQHFEVAHIPLSGVGFPSALEAAGGGIGAFASAMGVDPTKTHFVHRRAFGLGAHFGGVTGTVHLAKGVATGHQCHGFVVVHGHAGKGFAHIVSRQLGVGVAVRALWVDVDEAHLHGGQGVFEVALAAVAAVFFVAGGQPLFFRTPVDVFFGRPNVGAAATKTKGLEAHGFHGHIAAQDEQVSP